MKCLKKLREIFGNIQIEEKKHYIRLKIWESVDRHPIQEAVWFDFKINYSLDSHHSKNIFLKSVCDELSRLFGKTSKELQEKRSRLLQLYGFWKIFGGQRYFYSDAPFPSVDEVKKQYRKLLERALANGQKVPAFLFEKKPMSDPDLRFKLRTTLRLYFGRKIDIVPVDHNFNILGSGETTLMEFYIDGEEFEHRGRITPTYKYLIFDDDFLIWVRETFGIPHRDPISLEEAKAMAIEEYLKIAEQDGFDYLQEVEESSDFEEFLKRFHNAAAKIYAGSSGYKKDGFFVACDFFKKQIRISADIQDWITDRKNLLKASIRGSELIWILEEKEIAEYAWKIYKPVVGYKIETKDGKIYKQKTIFDFLET